MKTVYKPWGKEEWIELNERYCYKRIYINAGYKTSFQYHNFKRETNYIISGEAEVWLENENGEVEKKIMKSEEYFNVAPPKKHRVIALTDLIMQEVSTPEVDDVIRIDDEYFRENGKINSEHQKPAVLILAAGLGSRLKELTKDINKVLLPVNNKSVISHIIDKFPSEYDFIIATGYKSDSLIDYCKITHPKHNFTFVQVDNFDPLNSGPGYSALKCIDYLQRPFYFTMGDCLIDSNLPYLDGNWLGVHDTSYPEKYSTIKSDDEDNVISFMNKSENGYDYAFVGVGGITDYDTFWKELKKNLKDYELVSAFMEPKNYKSLKIKKLKWLDTGNLDDLEKTKEHFKDKPLSLKKNNGEITYNDNGKFLKLNVDKNILKNRVERSKYLKDLIPTNFGFTDNFIYYDWITGLTPYEIDDLNVFIKFIKQFENQIKLTKQGDVDSLQKFYMNKTFDRYNKFISKYGHHYFENSFQINDIKRNSLKSLLDKLGNFEILMNSPFYELFHGDLHFENIIYEKERDKFYYIDWRDSFGNRTDCGDLYYDLSKFYGGLLIPYNIMKNESNIILNEGSYSVKYSYQISDNLVKFKKIYENWVLDNGFDLQKIKLITGLIFLNMSPLHDDKFGKMLWFKSIEMLSDYDK